MPSNVWVEGSMAIEMALKAGVMSMDHSFLIRDQYIGPEKDEDEEKEED